MTSLIVANLSWHPLVPEGYGNRQRILALASHAQEVHVCLVGPPPPPRGWEERFEPVEPWRAPLPTPGFNREVLGFLHPKACARMARRATSLSPDVIVAEGLWAAPAARLAARGRCPWIITVNALEHVVLARRGAAVRAALVRLWERRWYGLADRLIAVSPDDASALERLLGPTHPPIDLVPNGVELPPEGVAPASLPHPNVVFVGKTDYPPNAAAIRTLETEWVPHARARGIPLTAVVVGGPATPCHREGIRFTGYVDSIWPYLVAADVCVAPLKAGSGTRLKVLAYLASGRPTIATGVAVEGLGLTPGVHYLPAEDGASFADALTRLLSDAHLRDSFRAHGHSLASRFAWPTIARRWAACVREAASSVSQRGFPTAALGSHP